MKTTAIKYLLSFVALGLTACGPQFETSYKEISSETVQKLGCEDFELSFWDNLKKFILTYDAYPEAKEINKYIAAELERLSLQREDLSPEELKNLELALTSLVEFIFKEAESVSKTPQEMLLLISAVDVGDRSTVFQAYLRAEVTKRIAVIKSYVKDLALQCEKEVQPEQPFDAHFLFSQPAQNAELSLPVWGTRHSFLTAYQSCEVSKVAALNTASENLKGVVITGKHSDGVGSKREIASLYEVQRSHPYLKDVKTYENKCLPVKENPLIYDYGGKPYASTAVDSPLDFFKDNGSGTKVLGIDCSGYVFSAFATAGLKFKVGRPLKASDAWSWGSGAFVEPQSNGLTCLEKIEVSETESLKAGDIVAVYGHVLILDDVGEDPFGISAVQKRSDCSKLNSNSFDFTVVQSSNSKSGVGINRFIASDYVLTSPKFKEGLEKYAQAACVAKFDKKATRPNLGTLSVVRHKGSAECLAKRVSLVREECIQGCSL